MLLDVLTYRFSGHSPSDALIIPLYRKNWKHGSSMTALRDTGDMLIEAGVCQQSDLDAIQADVKALILGMLRLVVDDNISPRMDLEKISGAHW